MGGIVFPNDFLFGAAICDYQHFGGANCDLPQISAAKHQTYFEEDFKIIKAMGLNAFRTSIEWARIEPEEGKIDDSAVRFYHSYFTKLKDMGVTTIITLHHFTNPKWVRKYKGWLSRETVERFLEYVDFVCQEYDQYIDYYVTINEPEIYTQFAYLVGERGLPPYHRNAGEASKCLENMNEAIREAYAVIHEKSKKAKVGVAQSGNPRILQTVRNTIKQLLAKAVNRWAVTNPIESWEGKYDFCGINYYCKTTSGRPVVYPEGLREFCQKIFAKYKKPILITENGLPNRDARQKTAYLMLHLKSLNDAITLDHVDVIGYCWWSFLHGYEWGLGYEPFFALVDVDINGSYKRTLTETAHIYSKIVKNKGFPLDLYERDCLPLKASIQFEKWP